MDGKETGGDAQAAALAAIKDRESAIKRDIAGDAIEIDLGAFSPIQVGLMPVYGSGDGSLWLQVPGSKTKYRRMFRWGIDWAKHDAK